jgi:sugar phosphate isomerase/epimerase
MWAVQARFEDDITGFLECARALGYEAIEINNSMTPPAVEAILACNVLPVTSVHAPAPLVHYPDRGWNRDLNLASLDEVERELAVRYTERSVDLAVEAGARHVVVHLGSVGSMQLDGERRLRELWPDREAQPQQWGRLVRETQRDRASQVRRYMLQAERSLAALVRYAEPRGVMLGIESRLNYHEIPLPPEAATLLAPYSPRSVGYWHDVGHVEVQHRLGLTDRETWFERLGDRIVGAHIHDMQGITDHRAPGTGDVDFEALASRLPAGIPHTLEIDQHESDADLARAVEVVKAAGL